MKDNLLEYQKTITDKDVVKKTNCYKQAIFNMDLAFNQFVTKAPTKVIHEGSVLKEDLTNILNTNVPFILEEKFFKEFYSEKINNMCYNDLTKVEKDLLEHASKGDIYSFLTNVFSFDVETYFTLEKDEYFVLELKAVVDKPSDFYKVCCEETLFNIFMLHWFTNVQAVVFEFENEKKETSSFLYKALYTLGDIEKDVIDVSLGIPVEIKRKRSKRKIQKLEKRYSRELAIPTQPFSSRHDKFQKFLKKNTKEIIIYQDKIEFVFKKSFDSLIVKKKRK